MYKCVDLMYLTNNPDLAKPDYHLSFIYAFEIAGVLAGGHNYNLD